MKSREQLKKEILERRLRESKERLERFTAKYGHLTTEELLHIAMEFPLRSEQNIPDKPTKAEQPIEVQRAEEQTKDKIDWDSPKQIRLFEKMGLVLKVSNSQTDKDDNRYFMNNIKLFVTGNDDLNNKNLESIFNRKFSEPVAEVCREAIVLFFQRDQKPGNRYKAKIYCDSDHKYEDISRIILQSGIDIEVEPYIC